MLGEVVGQVPETIETFFARSGKTDETYAA
jgi:hypothetical protein